MAARAGVSQQHVSDLELGRAGTMRLDDVDRLFRAIDARPVVTVAVDLVTEFDGDTSYTTRFMPATSLRLTRRQARPVVHAAAAG